MTAPCRTFAGATECGIEWVQWLMADALVRPGDTVLELGRAVRDDLVRYAAATNNSGRVISVEPDAAVHAALLANRAAHRCRFHAVLGVVSSAAMAMVPDGPQSYATQTAVLAVAPGARGDGPGAATVDRARRAAASAGPAHRRPGGLRRLSAPAARARRRARAPGATAAARGGRRGVAARVRRLVRRAARLRRCVCARASRTRWPGRAASCTRRGRATRSATAPTARATRANGACRGASAVRDARRPHAGAAAAGGAGGRRGRPRPPRSGHRKRPAGSRRRRTRRGRGRPPLLPSTGVRRPVPLCSSAFLPTLPPLRRSTC